MKYTAEDLPKEGLAGLRENWRADIVSGFLVFLIALPLCLGIAMASNFPPIAGIMTAVIGGLVVTIFHGSYITIKGPAAGLIVIVYGCVETMGYEATLAVIAVSGFIQILFGVFRTGVLGDFFPSSTVHGMLAAIGVIIAAKQIHTVIGVKPEAKETLGLIAEIPHSILTMNPEIALIGLISLCILFLLPKINNKYIRMIPAPMVVILIAIPLGHYFDLEHPHKYLFLDGTYSLGPDFLVSLPDNLMQGFTFPNFSKMLSYDSIYYIIMFALVGSIESLISTKAVDILDPYKRKSDLNKDLLATGIGNTLCGLLGALPMISEIVRSSANINNGAKTKWSNFFHGAFLLLFVALAPTLIHQIPLAALAAMLIYTGFRLSSPAVFRETYRVGKEQLLIFVTTLLVTLGTDLIIGIFSGILVKLIFHIYSGAPFNLSLIKSNIEVSKNEDNIYTLHVRNAAIFSNYLSLKKNLDLIPVGNKIIVDFSNAKLIDHTTMEHIHHYGEDYMRTGGEISIAGLEKFRSLSAHPLSYRIATSNAEQKLPRGKVIRNLSKALQFSYIEAYSRVQSNFGMLNPSRTRIIKYEGNIMSSKIGEHVFTVSDLSMVDGGTMKAQIFQVTVMSISNLHLGIPIFMLEKEALLDKIMEKAFIDDIDFDDYPQFSRMFKLVGINEQAIRSFFTKEIIEFFENNPDYCIESIGAELVIYKPVKKLLTPEEIRTMIEFGKQLISTIEVKTKAAEISAF